MKGSRIASLAALCAAPFLLGGAAETPFAREHRIVRGKLDTQMGRERKSHGKKSAIVPTPQSIATAIVAPIKPASLDKKGDELATMRATQQLEESLKAYKDSRDPKSAGSGKNAAKALDEVVAVYVYLESIVGSDKANATLEELISKHGLKKDPVFAKGELFEEEFSASRVASIFESVLNAYSASKDKTNIYAAIKKIADTLTDAIEEKHPKKLEVQDKFFKSLTQKDKEREIATYLLAYAKRNYPTLNDDSFFKGLTNECIDYTLIKLSTKLNDYKAEKNTKKKTELSDGVREIANVLGLLAGGKKAIALYGKELTAAGLDKDAALSFADAEFGIEQEQKGKFEVEASDYETQVSKPLTPEQEAQRKAIAPRPALISPEEQAITRAYNAFSLALIDYRNKFAKIKNPSETVQQDKQKSVEQIKAAFDSLKKVASGQAAMDFYLAEIKKYGIEDDVLRLMPKNEAAAQENDAAAEEQDYENKLVAHYTDLEEQEKKAKAKPNLSDTDIIAMLKTEIQNNSNNQQALFYISNAFELLTTDAISKTKRYSARLHDYLVAESNKQGGKKAIKELYKNHLKKFMENLNAVKKENEPKKPVEAPKPAEQPKPVEAPKPTAMITNDAQFLAALNAVSSDDDRGVFLVALEGFSQGNKDAINGISEANLAPLSNYVKTLTEGQAKTLFDQAMAVQLARIKPKIATVVPTVIENDKEFLNALTMLREEERDAVISALAAFSEDRPDELSAIYNAELTSLKEYVQKLNKAQATKLLAQVIEASKTKSK